MAEPGEPADAAAPGEPVSAADEAPGTADESAGAPAEPTVPTEEPPVASVEPTAPADEPKATSDEPPVAAAVSEPTEQPPRRMVAPAWLSIVGGAIVPGLGHLLLGRRRRAALLFAPILVVAVVAAAIVLAVPDRANLLGEALSPDILGFLTIVVVVIGLYRLVVLGATALLAARVRPARGAARLGRILLAAVLAIGIVAPHVILGAVIVDTRETIVDVFDSPGLGVGPGDDGSGTNQEVIPPVEPDTGDLEEPSASPSSGGAGTPTVSPTATPTLAPTATPGPAWAADGRLNVLLIGADAGPDRWSLRTDTMILLSVDVATGRSAMFGFPRNMTGAPLPRESAGAVPGGRFPGLLNSIYVYANAHPGQFPGGSVRGFRAIGGTIQKLAGVPLDGIAVVNLNGFVRLVDALGGVTIDIPRPLYDARYPLEDGSGVVPISFRAGRQHLDGHRALMYARSRHQDSDYGRMRRQQAVLVALRSRLKPCRLIPRVPTLLKIARDDAWTSFKPSDLPSLLSLAARTDSKHVKTLMFAPPTYGEAITDGEIRQIHKVVRGIFPSTEPDPTPTPPPVLAPDPMDPTPTPTDDPDPCA